MSDINPEQLVEQAKSGDRAAMDTLYRSISEPLYLRKQAELLGSGTVYTNYSAEDCFDADSVNARLASAPF